MTVSVVEEFVRQCTIYVEEVYDDSGNTIVGTRARALIDRDVRGNRVFQREVLCEAKCEPPATTPEQLGELLRRLGVMIGTEAQKAEST